MLKFASTRPCLKLHICDFSPLLGHEWAEGLALGHLGHSAHKCLLCTVLAASDEESPVDTYLGHWVEEGAAAVGALLVAAAGGT